MQPEEDFKGDSRRSEPATFFSSTYELSEEGENGHSSSVFLPRFCQFQKVCPSR